MPIFNAAKSVIKDREVYPVIEGSGQKPDIVYDWITDKAEFVVTGTGLHIVFRVFTRI